MKRFLIILLIMLMVCGAGCSRGNRREISVTAQRMNRAFIKIGNESIEVEVEAYYRDSDKVRIWTTDGKLYLTSPTNVVLICDEVE